MNDSTTGTNSLVSEEPAPADTTPHPVLLTVRQAATRLGLGRSTAYALISRGEVQVDHIGRSGRVPTDAVHDFVARLREGAFS